MASEELIASWERTERHLRAALDRQDLPQEALATAVDYIEHNEFGLAFEHVVSVLVERGIALNAEARESLAAAVTDMGLQANSDWIALGR
ncbi:MafI family immunity protein [Solirubrobacter taibaiensis]|nr:MafI family immunity protein [Solirubrobacter taibaiensis]